MACTLVAVLLHYFILVSFAWMLVEGVYLYIMVITVFENSKEQLRVYGACAYGKAIKQRLCQEKKAFWEAYKIVVPVSAILS